MTSEPAPDIPESLLSRLIHQQQLASISREPIDDRRLQAFPLQCSPHLLLVQYVYDFHTDGLMVIRRPDITAIESSATDRFQRALLSEAGSLHAVPWEQTRCLDSFTTFLAELPTDSMVILERESVDLSDFWIGRLKEVANDRAVLHEFTGTARWLDEPTDVDLSDLTSCQIGTRYIQFYEDYFKKRRFPDD